jgi:hypothetical protein
MGPRSQDMALLAAVVILGVLPKQYTSALCGPFFSVASVDGCIDMLNASVCRGWLLKLRGLDVASFPHFCNKLAKNNSRKQHEREDGALTAASTALTPENSVETCYSGWDVGG